MRPDLIEARRIMHRVLVFPADKEVKFGDDRVFRVNKVSATLVFKFQTFGGFCVSLNDISRDNPFPKVSLHSAPSPDFVLPEWCTGLMQKILGFDHHQYVPGMIAFNTTSVQHNDTTVEKEENPLLYTPTFAMCILRAYLPVGRNVIASWDVSSNNTDKPNDPFVAMTGDLSSEEARRVTRDVLTSIVIKKQK